MKVLAVITIVMSVIFYLSGVSRANDKPDKSGTSYAVGYYIGRVTAVLSCLCVCAFGVLYLIGA